MLSVVSTVRNVAGAVQDVVWLYEKAREAVDAWSRPQESPKEIELIEQYRKCRPQPFEPPIWQRESEPFDEGWVLCNGRSYRNHYIKVPTKPGEPVRG